MVQSNRSASNPDECTQYIAKDPERHIFNLHPTPNLHGVNVEVYHLAVFQTMGTSNAILACDKDI